MTTERWRDRVQKAWLDIDEARKWRQRVDDNDAEERVKGATENFWRALVNRPPIPPEVREAQRRLDEFCEDHPYALDDDPILMERDQQLQQQVTDAECAAGIHTSCNHRHHWRKPSNSPPDDGEVSGDWLAEQRAKTWGVIQPDGTVVAKGFLGDADAQEDMAVHPPGAIAVHGAGGWTNAATGHPASEGPAGRPDEDPPPTEPETPVRPRDLPSALDQQRILDDHGPWTNDRATDAERSAARRFWDAVKSGDDTARNTAFTQYSDAKQARRDAANAAARAEALREVAAKRPETWSNLSTWSEEFLRESEDRARVEAQSSNELEAGAARSFLAGAEHERRRRNEEAASARTQPPEPPVGTVLETRDSTDDYRIERTDTGWRLQYRDGEDEHGRRLHPGWAGRGISWPAAWSAWGPPSGAAPFREVPGDSPLLPSYPDASGSRLDPPPAAVPYAPPVRADRQVCEPEKTTPPTGGTTTGSTGGTGMSIEAARAQIMGGHQTGQDALGAINQAHEMVGDARNDLWQATEGSNQAEAEPARAQLTEAMTKLEEAEQQVASALQEFENVANRL